MLFFGNGESFAAGSTTYTYRPVADRETSPRIILPVLIEGFETTGFVDTGGVYLLFSSEVASYLGLRPEAGIPTERLTFRRVQLSGVLHRVELTLLAEDGVSLMIEATAFVPELAPNQEWLDDFPCVLGMSGCLERLRFAVDPTNDTFYFGEKG
jgi:hypothetical protein